MTPRERMAKVRGFLVDLGGAFTDTCRAVAQGLARAWGRIRPGAAALWRRARPLLIRGWTELRRGAGIARVWLAPRLGTCWAMTRAGARSAGGGLRRAGARLRRLRRPTWLAARTLLLAASITGLVLGAGWAFLVRVPPGVIAVRQVKWGGAGMIERDHGPGLHWTVAGRDAWYHLPAGTHVVHFAWENEGGNHPILEIATREGEVGQAAVLVPYRVREGEAWRMVADGLRADFSTRAVAVCRRVLLEELAALSAKDFSDPRSRRRIEAVALARLDEELGAAHLEPLGVHIGSVFFNPTYEKKLAEQQLAALDERTQASLAARKAEQRETERIQEQLDDEELVLVAGYTRQIATLEEENADEIARLERDAQRDRARKRSETEIAALVLQNEGQLALAAADELRQKLTDEALQLEAGRLHIARQAAENLRFGTVTLDSSDPRVPSVLDLDEFVALLMGSEGE